MKEKRRIHRRRDTRQNVRRRMIAAAFLICCVLCFMCGYVLRGPLTVVLAESVQSSQSAADHGAEECAEGRPGGHDTDHAEHQKYYKSVAVERGDSLYEIAAEYFSGEYRSIEDLIAEIKQINHMHSSHLESGDYVIVPYYSCMAQTDSGNNIFL